MNAPDEGEQLELLRAQVRTRRPKPPAPLAEQDPVAAVVLDVPPPHLDRPFDYAVPATMTDAAVPGARVRVRFAGQDVDGFVVARTPTSEHTGRLTPLRRVVGSGPVLDPGVLRLARAVADRYAGTLADVLRLAVPPRHARAEAGPFPPAPTAPTAPPPGPWTAYRGGPAFLTRVGNGDGPRAVWTALPGQHDHAWPHAVAVAVATTLAGGRGALVVLPDHRDVARVEQSLTGLLGEGHHVRLTADTGPQVRYAAYLAVLGGQVKAVVGTRAAVFAPVQDLGLVVIWDDGDDVLTEPRAPYPHALDVLTVRAEQTGAAFLAGSHARSVAAEQLVQRGWAMPVVADRPTVRARTPKVVLTGDDDLRDPAARTARLPSLALRTARQALATGPVLVQVPRTGYVPSLACQQCRTPARCRVCHGPLAHQTTGAAPTCRWCGHPASDWACERCGGHRLRSVVVGAERTAEELGRAFAGVPVRVSGGAAPVRAAVDDRPQLVVATPGAEPLATDGYAAALLLDTWVPLARPDLRAAEEALRRWFTAAALVRPGPEGGAVVVVGESSLAPLQALVRWDPAGYAARESAERQTLGLPPAVAMAEVRGTADGVEALLVAARLPAGAQVLGPVAVPLREGASADDPAQPQVRALVRVGSGAVDDLGRALLAARAVVSAARRVRPPRVQVDPPEVG